MEILRGNYNNNNNKLTLKVGTIYFFHSIFTEYVLCTRTMQFLCYARNSIGIKNKSIFKKKKMSALVETIFIWETDKK